MTTREMLEKLQNGEISIDEAERFFRQDMYEDMGYAKLDTLRESRTGFPEVIFCEGKQDAYLADICRKLYEKNGEFLGTRASKHQAEAVRQAFSQGPEIRYDEVSRILKLEKPGKEQTGCIAVCSGGTADIPVAEEAAQTAEFFGAKCERIYDIGVSGLHRLLGNLDRIQAANCVVAVAGMEGALVSVLGGLVENPVIAVPTSVGYGVSEGGKTALRAMLSSCANGVAVVNIDNGYGAGYLATQINRLACR
ncbi:MAG: nickel pincer cofactor biosynthesis protein LarB [Lachnospiraceae bacterium]|nr:nickel pincer cofactor biosynthesis protein LarB [Lachnospiraceae bacterium]